MIVPFIPSGLWPRLISRLITDPAILQLAKAGCGITPEGGVGGGGGGSEGDAGLRYPLLPSDAGQLSWIKWRQGLILQYGNLTLLQIEELNGGLYTGGEVEGIKVLQENKWAKQT